MKTIQVAAEDGELVTMDYADYEAIREYPLVAYKAGRTSYVDVVFGKETMALHRVLMGKRARLQVDHINGDGLDNRRANLRWATPSQNAANSRLHADSSSGFKGVTRRGPKWAAKVSQGGRYHYLGSFGSPEDAARAYDEAAARLHGEFAKTNAALGLL